MRLSKYLVLLLCFIFLVILPAAVMASTGRIYSLSLNSNDYWMLPDSSNIFSNPAYINLYPQTLAITAAEKSGKPTPFSSLSVKLDDRITFGVTLGYPYSSFYNIYCAGNPGDSFQHFKSTVDDSKIPGAGDIQTDNYFLHFGYSMDNLKLGLSASYIGLKTQDINETVLSAAREVKTTSHRDFYFNMGMLTGKTGPFESIAANIAAKFPYLTRKYSYTTLTSSDTKEINGTQAWIGKLGFAGNIYTATDNYLTLSANYAAENFNCSSFEHRDNNNDGDFTDIGEIGIDDSFLTQRYSIKYGLSDRLLLDGRGFVFISAYSNIYKFKQYAKEVGVDGIKHDSSAVKTNRYTVPVIIGGEIIITDWLTVRISGAKDIVCFTKTYDEPGNKVSTDYTSTESNAIINAGLGVTFHNFSADLLLDTPWGGSSDPPARDYNEYISVKLCLSWRF